MNRTQSVISAIVVIVVNVAAWAGHTIDPSTATTVVTGAAALAALVWGIWKNHNLTDAALQAQGVLKGLKSDADDAELAEVAASVENREGE